MNKRNIIITAIVVILVIILAVVATAHKKGATPQSATTTTEGTDEATMTTTKSGTKSATPTSPLSRKDALPLYEHKIVRITDDCLPDRVTDSFMLKKGDRIMLDNDAAKAHTVVLAGVTYQISAHGYRTAALAQDGTVSSTCDPKTGVTTVSVATPAQ